jgi:hypothetical protein
MNIQSALIPHKHTRFNDSIITLAGRVRDLLDQPRSIDEIWSVVSGRSNAWGVSVSFTHLVLAVDMLYAIRQIKLVADGRVCSVDV